MFPDYLSDSYDYNLSKEKIQSKNNRKGKSFSQKSLLHEKYECHAYGPHIPINTNRKLYCNKSSHRPTNT